MVDEAQEAPRKPIVDSVASIHETEEGQERLPANSDLEEVHQRIRSMQTLLPDDLSIRIVTAEGSLEEAKASLDMIEAETATLVQLRERIDVLITNRQEAASDLNVIMGAEENMLATMKAERNKRKTPKRERTTR